MMLKRCDDCLGSGECPKNAVCQKCNGTGILIDGERFEEEVKKITKEEMMFEKLKGEL